ncbi:hypothetical protein HPP92_028954 [Vanilla planifolia]|uniref:Uncharacterized protein n=1 Tax=Vanilla planifolia TaxID=51239 RepID=A0A835U2R6_VANPL|nr:hypothetical protein HPP92_028954 [Vanilla planifolia]
MKETMEGYPLRVDHADSKFGTKADCQSCHLVGAKTHNTCTMVILPSSIDPSQPSTVSLLEEWYA